jgi:hypothetical protein
VLWARLEVQMIDNNRRFGSYKKFGFRTVIGTALAAVAGLALLKRFRTGSSSANYRDPKDYLPTEPTSPPPIITVGTTTVGRDGTASKSRRKASPTSPSARRSTRKKAPRGSPR